MATAAIEAGVAESVAVVVADEAARQAAMAAAEGEEAMAAAVPQAATVAADSREATEGEAALAEARQAVARQAVAGEQASDFVCCDLKAESFSHLPSSPAGCAKGIKSEAQCSIVSAIFQSTTNQLDPAGTKVAAAAAARLEVAEEAALVGADVAEADAAAAVSKGIVSQRHAQTKRTKQPSPPPTP